MPHDAPSPHLYILSIYVNVCPGDGDARLDSKVCQLVTEVGKTALLAAHRGYHPLQRTGQRRPVYKTLIGTGPVS
jgi:hypothetical protein